MPYTPEAMPLHLLLNLMQSMSFGNAWRGSNASWPSFANLANPFANGQSQLEQSAGALFHVWESLSQHANAHTEQFFEGLKAYTNADYVREESPHHVIWSKGSARLLDYAPKEKDGLAILCIPSLINKYYVLDLAPKVSFVAYLKAQGFRPLVLDWGEPGPEQEEFSTADYITAYALEALKHLREQHEGPIALTGYCMGGIFTLAMAQLAPLFVDALILLATPWDFSADDTPRILLEPSSHLVLRQWIQAMNPVPPVVTQTLFHLIDPWKVQEKYRDFVTLSGEERAQFLAIEHWANDGVALPQNVAEECFIDWPQGNILAEHKWKVGRRWIDPSAITCPTLAVIPEHDKIVPVGVATPLAKAIKRCDILHPDAGHVSMVAGRRAEAELWKPLTRWLQRKF